MKEKLNKVKAWIKENKTKILIGTGAAVLGGIAVYAIGKSVPKLDLKSTTLASESLDGVTKHFKPDITIGALDDALQYKDGSIELWMDNIKINELGQLGEEFLGKLPNVNEDSNVWALMCIKNPNNT